MTKKKVLIITYYWPPSGGAGVQRWLKFVKYLPKYGWEPVIFTVDNGEYPSIDESLENDIPDGIEVIKSKIWEPYSFYKKFTGRKKDELINAGFLKERKKAFFLERLSVWVRGNFFIPDARKFWIKPSTRILSSYLKDNSIDVVISSGPPHSTHLIAKKITANYNLPWIADFRDPWTNIDFYNDLMLSKFADRKHKRLEKLVLSSADIILTVGKTLALELSQLGAKRVEVVENGYDKSDLNKGFINQLDDKFSIAHIGTFSPSRNNETLWKALSELVKEDDFFFNKLELKLIGKIDYSVTESLKKYDLASFVNHIPYLSHDLVINQQMSSHLLLLMVNNTPNAKGIVTGKIFEYMASNRPTLVIGPSDGDVAEIVSKCNAGVTCDFDDIKKMKVSILNVFYKKQVNEPSIENYSREALTMRLSNMLNDITK